MTINLTAANAAIQGAFPKLLAECFTRFPHWIQLMAQQQGWSPETGPGRSFAYNKGGLPTWRVVTAAGHAAVGTHAEMGPYTAADNSTQANVTIPDWGRLSEAVDFSEEASLALMEAGDSQVTVDRLLYETQNMLGASLTKLNTFLLTNDQETPGNANAPHGLDSVLGLANTYAGVARGANAWWVPTVVNGGGVALTEADMENALTSIRYQRNGRCDAIICSAVKAALIQAFTANNVVQVVGNPNVPPAEAIGTWNATDVLSPRCYFDGIPVFAVGGHTDNLIHFVSWDDLALEALQWYTISPLQQVQNEPRFVARITAHVQLCYKNPFRNGGVIWNIP